MSRKDILGNEIKTECIGCSIANGEIKLPGGILYDGKGIILAADPEIPIPGFLIITSKRHIQSFSELLEDERAEIGSTIAWAEKAIKELNIADTVTLVQEERSKHFHIWIFPNQEWMKEKFGWGLQYMRDINSFARENATAEDTEEVIAAIERIREYMRSEGIREKYDVGYKPPVYSIEKLECSIFKADDFENTVFLDEGSHYYVLKDGMPYCHVVAEDSRIMKDGYIIMDYLVIASCEEFVFISLIDFSVLNKVKADTYASSVRSENGYIFLMDRTGITALNSELEVLWDNHDLAVDGVVFGEMVSGDAIAVSCEMDPPGGWVTKYVDLKNGKEVHELC